MADPDLQIRMGVGGGGGGLFISSPCEGGLNKDRRFKN